MAEAPPAVTEMDPTFETSERQTYTPRPLGPDAFTGMVDTSEKAVENRYRYNAVSSQGGTNAIGGTGLFNNRLKADIELSKDPNSGYNAWNKKRQEAIERGEDPNSELLAKIEAGPPDSYVERAWRTLTGKKKTKKEEMEAREAKERNKMRVEPGV